jgi:GTP cyclohydrolase IA
MSHEKLSSLVREILLLIGEDPTRPGLVETPDRVARAYKEMFRGYGHFDFKLKEFPSKYSGMVFRGPVPFFSFCEHHMLSYEGRAYFGYIPDGKVVGASKMIRFIQHCGARLTIQEELTDQIVDVFMKEVQPQGCGLVMSASHLCEACRGVRVPDVPFGTQSLRGIFQEPSVKEEFLWRCGAKL